MTSLPQTQGRAESPILTQLRERYQAARDALHPKAPAPAERERRIIHLSHPKPPAPSLPYAMERAPKTPRREPAPPPRARDIIHIAVDIVQPLPPSQAWRQIVSEVCLKHGIDWLEMASARRSRPVVLARNEAAYRLRHETTMSLPQIGRKLGGRDHTTILHSVRQHEARLRGEVYVAQPGRYQKPEAMGQ
jgi:hypothetical protein